MALHAPFHPESALPKKADPDAHEFLEDVVQDDGIERKQRLLAWVCAILTAALVAAVWYLL